MAWKCTKYLKLNKFKYLKSILMLGFQIFVIKRRFEQQTAKRVLVSQQLIKDVFITQLIIT